MTRIWNMAAGRIACCLLLLASAPAMAEDAKEEAQRHYRAGVEAFDKQRFAEAEAEFRQAYALRADYRVLYNLGQVYAALGKPIESVDAFERNLRDGGSEIDPARQAKVRQEIERQRAKIGILEITTSEPGAEVRVDGQDVGTSPLGKPIRVAAGEHVVEASLGGRKAERRTITVAGRQTASVRLDIEPADAEPAAVTSAEAAPEATAPGTRPPDIAPHPAPAGTSGPPVQDSTPGPAASEGGGSQRIIGLVIAGIGGAAGITGLVLQLGAKSQYDDASDQCTATGCPKDAIADQEQAKDRQTVALGVLGAGAAIAATGLVLFVTAPSKPSSPAMSVRMGPTPGRGGAASFRAVW